MQVLLSLGNWEKSLHNRILLFFLPLLAGCISPVNRPAVPPGAVFDHELTRTSSYTSSSAYGIVYVADGSGNTGTLSYNLAQAVGKTSVPLQVKRFDWSHGDMRVLADHLDKANHLAQGRRLAAEAIDYLHANPGSKVYLAGHSSGTAVILRAAESLPPDSIEKIILLGPSVCASYDLRPALQASRSGMDVFYSDQDVFVLGLAIKIFGTADGECRDSSGQHGFKPMVQTPQDGLLYQRLRQHPWNKAVAWTGNDGSHYGSIRPQFLRAYVVPELVK
jgi:pimeloyl-ACP methyl ester carboxylesterase